MEYRILGPTEVLSGEVLVDASSRPQRALLALLLLHVNRVVSTDRILEEFRPGDLEGKEKTLWVYISRLRSALEKHRAGDARSWVLAACRRG
jgi:DNA-binding response OmpR family regulator